MLPLLCAIDTVAKTFISSSITIKKVWSGSVVRATVALATEKPMAKLARRFVMKVIQRR